MIKLTNPTKLHKLGWKHKTSLENGITEMFMWYKKKVK